MKLLVLILTSSEIDLLKRGIKSIKNQLPVKLFTYDLKIVVNTLNDKYYKEVLENIKDIEIIKTESNGYPGKGHNSCLDVFKNRKEYTHLTILDGDDMFYPSALQQFEKMLIKEPKLDLVHLFINDKIVYKNPNNNYYKSLKHKFKLIGCFNDNKNWWKNTNSKSPLINHLTKTKTPSRIILASRNIFKTTIPIRYDEDMKLFDDMIAFCAFYEAELKKEIKTFSTSESNIYCYNALNYSSMSHNFNDHDKEDQLFKDKVLKYKNVIKHGWRLYELPFISVKQPENFSIQDKINFCNKEVIDFQINNISNHLVKLFKNKDLYDKNRILIQKYLKILLHCGLDTHKVYLYTNDFYKKNIIQFITNLILMTNIYPSVKSYTIIFNILYSIKNYSKCLYYYKLLEKYDSITDDIKSKYDNIIKQQNKIKKNKITFYHYRNDSFDIKSTKKIFCYYTGYTPEFNGKNYGEKQVYGSEIAAIKLCEELTDKYNVFIICNTQKYVKHNNVGYINIREFKELKDTNKVNYLVISRFIGIILDIDLTNIQNIYYIMHDARVHCLWQNKNLPLMSAYTFKNYLNKIKKIIFVSKWQKENYLKRFNMSNVNIDKKSIIIGNGINTSLSKYKKVKKINNRFIYCSDPDRGLDMLCDILIELKKKYSDITLDIYFGNLPNKYQKYLNYNWIKYNGKISNDKIFEELSKSDFWLYPNMNSHETFCISCLEAMSCGNVVITRNYSALPEIIGDCGILIPENLSGEKFKEYTIDKINNILSNNLKKQYQENAYKRSLKYDWKNISQKWIKMIN